MECLGAASALAAGHGRPERTGCDDGAGMNSGLEEFSDRMPSTVKARVNEGRWIADCPDCSGAELVMLGEPFVCKSKNHGVRYDVEWPTDKDEIEAALAVRKTVNRHWSPGESVEDLQRENREHGIVVDR